MPNMPLKMARPISLGQEELRLLFDYEPDSGLLRWRAKDRSLFGSDSRCRGWNARFAGAIAGTKKQSAGKQYIQVGVDGRVYPCHRLIWILLHGSIDEALVIDHLNGVGTDNRLANLRLVTHSDNQRNQALRVTNRSGVIGVYWCRKTMKWTGQITANGKHRCIGYYSSIDDAAKARKALEVELGYHPLHGVPGPLKAVAV